MIINETYFSEIKEDNVIWNLYFKRVTQNSCKLSWLPERYMVVQVVTDSVAQGPVVRKVVIALSTG